jgi:hypothetical protein
VGIAARDRLARLEPAIPCRSIERNLGDVNLALREMQAAGVRIVTATDPANSVDSGP